MLETNWFRRYLRASASGIVANSFFTDAQESSPEARFGLALRTSNSSNTSQPCGASQQKNPNLSKFLSSSTDLAPRSYNFFRSSDVSSPAVVIPIVIPSGLVAEPRAIAVQTSSLATCNSSNTTRDGWSPCAVPALAAITLYTPVPSEVQRPLCSVEREKRDFNMSEVCVWWSNRL